MARRFQRAAVVTVAVCGFVLYLTGVASAAAAQPAVGAQNTTLVNKTGTTVTVVAGVGRANTITVRQVGNSIRVRDTGDFVAASGACTQVSATEASCPAANTTTELVVNAGDQNDSVTSELDVLGVTLIGGPGNDTLTGGAANDTIEGDAGDDAISGGAGNDTLTGDVGNDRILGGAGNDSISGGDGADLINGGPGNDVIDGGNGNDHILAGSGSDFVEGGPGNDVINAVDGVPGNDFVFGGPGNDTCTADFGDSVNGC